MRTISSGGVRLAVLVTGEDHKKGLNFCSEDTDFIQVGFWGYDSGKELVAHWHNYVERTVTRTQEVVHVMKGRVKSLVYSKEELLIEEVILEAGDTLVLLDGGHGYEILEDNTCVLEVKNGPYVGADKDRRRFS